MSAVAAAASAKQAPTTLPAQKLLVAGRLVATHASKDDNVFSVQVEPRLQRCPSDHRPRLSRDLSPPCRCPPEF